jgi:hypothetical protein
MKPIVFPDYKKSILNVSTSILNHYGVKISHPTLPLLDSHLSKNYRNIVLILVDGLGEDAIIKHLSSSSKLYQNMASTLTSVFPSTTVAATTSVLSGKTPLETGWLGWHQYISEEDASVIFFLNRDYYSLKSYDYLVAERYVPYLNIYQQITAVSPHIHTHEIFPAFRTPEHTTFAKICETIKNTIQADGKHFVYAYWDKVDSLMHEYGPYSKPVHDMIMSVEEGYANLIASIEDDTLVIVIADHGQVDVETIQLTNYPLIIDTLKRLPSNESRASVFYVKDSMHEVFENAFNSQFRQYFNLYKTEDLLKMGLFGNGKEHPRLRDFLGDYVAIAIDHYILSTVNNDFVMRGQHAGLLKEEMIVPLIIHSPKK